MHKILCIYYSGYDIIYLINLVVNDVGKIEESIEIKKEEQNDE